MYKFILASASPRRRSILEKLNIPFEVIVSGAEEHLELEHSPYEWVKILSERKASAVAPGVKGPAVIIGADTIVTYLGKILIKPTSEAEAFSMLRQLSGKKHTVYTGMTLIFIDQNGNREVESYVDATEVTMLPITDEEIRTYISTEEYADKAGGYAIQGKSSVFIESIYGSYDTVVGLPTYILYKALKDHGIDITKFWK
ncbi:MAG: Maf family protein [Clostridia bacterium]|jgi:septum formation protein|nr:Maf family protein [Clostridia bacterium]MCI2001138.1 Maf family protein [Clostridia bacterium]MCI2015828.1 Maf family protein [Clostridia bacterium]